MLSPKKELFMYLCFLLKKIKLKEKKNAKIKK